MNINPFDIENRRILITGASSGIGRQCAIDCSKVRAKLVIIGRNKERLEETLNLLDGTGHKMICADITQFEDISRYINETVSENGAFDGYVQCAGIEKTQLLKNLKPKDYEEVYNTNFVAGVNILKTLSKKGNYQNGFKTVLISSITASIARIGTLAYTASKGALVAAARELAVELAPKGINVNCISPGTILTPMMEKVLDEMSEADRLKRIDGFPLGLGRTEDISSACIFLLSDAARWITGHNLIIDGGYTAK